MVVSSRQGGHTSTRWPKSKVPSTGLKGWWTRWQKRIKGRWSSSTATAPASTKRVMLTLLSLPCCSPSTMPRMASTLSLELVSCLTSPNPIGAMYTLPLIIPIVHSLIAIQKILTYWFFTNLSIHSTCHLTQHSIPLLSVT